MSDLLVPQNIAVVESYGLNVLLPSATFPLCPHQNVKTPVIEVTHKDGVLGEALGHTEVLRVLPDEHVLELLEVNELHGRIVLGLIAEMSVG